MKVSFLFAECACGEAQPSALVEVDGEIICGNWPPSGFDHVSENVDKSNPALIR